MNEKRVKKINTSSGSPVNFEEYLQKENLAKRTIKEHLQNIKHFKNWSKSEALEAAQLNYREILGYLQNEKQRKLNHHTINIKLNTISKYYDCLISEGIRVDNPAKKLRLKKDTQKVLLDQLKPEQLQQIYNTYKSKTNFREAKQKRVHQRNLIILGLMIHQGVQIGELKRLEVNHIDFDKGEIYIPSTKRSNHRTLKIHSTQIIPLHTYTLQTREKLNLTDDFLFTRNLANIMNHFIQELRGMFEAVRSLQQLRASVIMNWIKHHNIREVQYYAGHKHISSTEKYRQQEVETLQKSLEKYHPMENLDS
jgi:integrase/recombinase XerD